MQPSASHIDLPSRIDVGPKAASISFAGCSSAGVLCEVVDRSTGEMAKTDLLLQMAQEHGLHCVTIKDLIRHRVQHEPLVAAADAAGALSAGDLELKAVQCIDGSRAAYGVVGQLQDAASASLFFHEVRWLAYHATIAVLATQVMFSS